MRTVADMGGVAAAPPTDEVGPLGFAASTVAAVASTGYSIAAIASVLGLLAEPWEQILVFAPSLLLAPAFVVAMVAIHARAPAGKRVWSQAGLAFAVIYAALVGMVYITQLAVVIPSEGWDEGSDVGYLAVKEGTFMTAIDTLGYAFMGLAMLLAAPVFGSDRLERSIRRFFIANGMLAPSYVLALASAWFLILGIWWWVAVPGAMVLLARWFHRPVAALDT